VLRPALTCARAHGGNGGRKRAALGAPRIHPNLPADLAGRAQASRCARARNLEIRTSASRAIFSNLTPALTVSLKQHLQTFDGAECLSESIEALVSKGRFDPTRICLLDPKAEEPLAPADRDAFDVFLFGGILGDDPPRDRTAELRKLGFPSRHLGRCVREGCIPILAQGHRSVQMTTDTAVTCTQRVIATQSESKSASWGRILTDSASLDQLDYIDHPTIQFNIHESTQMPFRYLTEMNNKERPLMPDGMRELLYADTEKAFEF
jgi:ribosome biogenesis SPOUT family RNA methylase Rps3